MPTRNMAVLQRITEPLGDQPPAPADALIQLEEHFHDSPLIIAGDVTQAADQAETLRLAITASECGLVLDYIAHESLAGINVDHVETAINTPFLDRFIEPSP